MCSKGDQLIPVIKSKNFLSYVEQKPLSRAVPADRLKLFNEFLHSDDPNVQITPEDDDNQNDDLQDNQVDDAQDNQQEELDEEQEPSNFV